LGRCPMAGGGGSASCRFCGKPTTNADKVCDSEECRSELEWEKMVDVVWTFGG